MAFDSLLDAKSGLPIWYRVLNFFAILIMIALFSANWIPSLIYSLRFVAPFLFVFSLSWEICTASHAVEISVRDISEEIRPVVRRWMMGLEVITAFIGFWFGAAAILKAK